jgi:hypothetical protein
MTRAALALLFLLPVDQYAHAASASESPRPLKSFWVEDFEKVIIPSNSDLGKTVQLSLDGSECASADSTTIPISGPPLLASEQRTLQTSLRIAALVANLFREAQALGCGRRWPSV